MAENEFPERGRALSKDNEANADRSLTRRDLFDLVWSMPMGKVAATLGTSTRGLARFCSLAGLPVPGRGFWRGRRDPTQRPALPEPSIGFPDFHLHLRSAGVAGGSRCEATFPVTIDAIRSKLLATMSEGAPVGIIRLRRQYEDDENLRRMLLVDMLSRGVEEVGGSLRHEADPFRPISISIGSQIITLILGVGAPLKKTGNRSAGTSGLEAHNFRIAELATPYAGRVRREWRDAGEQPLEDRISHIVADLMVEAEARCRRELSSCLSRHEIRRSREGPLQPCGSSHQPRNR